MKQTIKVSIDSQELTGVHQQEWETLRKEVTTAGAIGVANNTGVIGLTLNDHAAVRLWIHEDALGYVVVDVLDGRTNAHLARVDAELFGMVPPRLTQKRTK